MGKRLHIVHFDIAYPPDYGGAMAEYYLFEALADAGVEITLHAFEYGDRKPNHQLEKLARKVFYYPRPFNPIHLLNTTPYIVRSRRKTQLLKNLLEDEAPILFDGLQSTGYVSHPKLQLRKKIVRLHNIDWKYYQELARLERNPIKQLYFRLESGKLKEYEEIACQEADEITCLSGLDYEYYRNQYLHVHHIPPAHPYGQPRPLTGKGKFILFHGNLSINDNAEAAIFLCNEVFGSLNVACKIAGKSPGDLVRKACAGQGNVELISDPDEAAMDDLIRNAHINVLYANQGAGIKMKLLHALYKGRFCVANQHILAGSGLHELCARAETGPAFVSQIERIMPLSFNKALVNERRKGLEAYNNEQTTGQYLELL